LSTKNILLISDTERSLLRHRASSDRNRKANHSVKEHLHHPLRMNVHSSISSLDSNNQMVSLPFLWHRQNYAQGLTEFYLEPKWHGQEKEP